MSQTPSGSQPSSWPHTAFHRGHTFPDPSNRGACARFRLRQKGSKASSFSRRASPSNPDILQLRNATLDLSRQLNHLSELVLQQAITFRDHLSHVSLCTVPVPNVSVAPLVSAPPSFQGGLAESASGSNTDDARCVRDVTENPLGVSLVNNINNPTPSVPQADQPSYSLPLPGKCQAQATEVTRPSFSSTLPGLRGLFNKPRQKVSNQQGVSTDCSSTKPG